MSEQPKLIFGCGTWKVKTFQKRIVTHPSNDKRSTLKKKVKKI